MDEMNTNGNALLTILYALLEALEWPCNPETDDIQIGAGDIGVRREGFAGEVSIRDDGAVNVRIEASPGRARVNVALVAAHSFRSQSFAVEPKISWPAIGSVSAEEGAAFGGAMLAWSGRLQAAAAALAPLVAMTPEERKDGATQLIQWIDAHTEQFVEGLCMSEMDRKG